MAPSSMKYNPAFLDDDRLIKSFVARNAELETILEVLRENTAGSNQHLLIIGPRGIGKTTLVLRSAAEIRTDATLGAQLHPVVFGEETYQVSSPGEFWLEALFHIGEQTGNARWQKAYEELLLERDEARLRARVLAQLMDFADEQKKRLVLVVENLNMLVGDQISGDDAWVLRHTLMNEPRLMLLGTATSRFKEVEEYNQALYDLFRTIDLEPLEDAEVQALWTATTGQGTTARQIRPLQILTGGNPRLIRILSEFAANTSFRSLMDDLTRLVDEHTEYFKHHLDNLPPQERKVFVALADLWDPSTARKVAEAARLDVNTASAMLRRLIGRGAVTMAYKRGKAQYYQVAERMYNIYHLMRRRGPAASRVHAVVRFMVSLYRDEELVRTTKSLVEEARQLTVDQRREHFLAYEAILTHAREPQLTKQLVEATRFAFETMQDVPASLQRLIGLAPQPEPVGEADLRAPDSDALLALRVEDVDDVATLRRLANLLVKLPDRLDQAEAAIRKITKKDPGSASAWHLLGSVLGRVNRSEEALESFDRALELGAMNALVWFDRSATLIELGRPEDALESLDRGLAIDTTFGAIWSVRGALFVSLGRHDDALESFERALELDTNDAAAWFSRGLALRGLGRVEKALESFDRALELDAQNAKGWHYKGVSLNTLRRWEDAIESFDRALELDASSTQVWFARGAAMLALGRADEAVESYDRALAIDPKSAVGWFSRGVVLAALQRPQEALESVDRGLALNAPDAAAWFMKGVALRFLSRPEEALESWDRALELDPKHVRAWFNKGVVLLALGRPKEALEAMEHALGLDAENAEAWFTRATILTALSQWEEALESLNRALELNPKSADGWLNRGTALIYLERSQDALESLDRALELNPESAVGWSNRGAVLISLGRMEEALESLSRALGLDAENAALYLSRGIAYRTLKRFQEAETDLRRALALGIRGVSAPIALVELLLENLNQPEEALVVARESIDQVGSSDGLLNSIAWAFFKYGRKAHWKEAEAWARRTVDGAPESGFFRHTFASLLGAQGKWEEALEQAEVFVRDQEMIDTALDEVIDFFIDAVAAGHEDRVLMIIQASAGVETFEPLVVAIHQRNGAQIDVAREILEVAKDVSARIEARGKELRDGSAPRGVQG